MTILVLGDGLLGSAFADFATVLDRQECDITFKKEVPIILDHYKPTVVINCAGIVPKRNASTQETFKVNAFAPHLLSEQCAKRNIKLVHISTNCVFNGREHGKYVETEEPDATDIYGVSKLLGEPASGLVIRTSFVGLPDPKGHGLLAWAENQAQEIIGYDKVFWNGVTTLELAHKVLELIKEDVTGVRHVFGYTASKYALLMLANDIFGWGQVITRESEAFEEVHHENKTLVSLYQSGFVNKPIKQQLEELKVWNQ